MSTDLRKRKITYTIILTSDSPKADARKMHIKTGALAAVSFALFVAVICYAVYVTITMAGSRDRNARQLEQIVQMKAENETLTAENETLGNKVATLEETLNRKEEQEQELVAAHEENYTPRGFPMSGAAQIKEEDTAAQEAEAQDDGALKVEANKDWKELIFVAAEGTKVVATAPGTVKEVREAEGEVSYVVIDHGNGYVTTYRNLGSPIVEEGSQVVKGVALFLVGEENTETGYSIRKDDEYIDPLELIEIKG